ncbi:MAG: metal-dependent transcriptional regulator [Chloroflexi bacterium]|nr:metal-dependent transcriptional regulator [Chloroflexota bacterium]
MKQTETTATAEEYLEAIYMLADEGQRVIGARLAELLRVSPPTVTATIKRLVRDGHVRLGVHKEVELTPKGIETAEQLMRRHRLVERWLTDVLGMGWAKADAEAHRIEHALSPEVETLLNKYLGYPSTCPHGNPIPGNPPPQDKDWRPLTTLQTGEAFVIQRVAEPVENAIEVLYFVEARGMVPGAAGVMLDHEPHEGALTLRVGERVVSVSHYIASNIYVR